MNRCLLIVCGFLVGSLLGDAGEQPINAGSFPEDEYLILNVSESQLEEIDSRRRITLSKTQLNQLRALAPSFPKRIGVASPFVEQIPDSRFSLWPGQVNGLWFRKDKVAIARSSLGGAAGCREFSATLHDSDAVLIGVAGDYWIGPRRVDQKKLVKCLDTLANKEPEGAAFGVFVLRPPINEDPQEEQTVQAALDRLVELCRERDLICEIGG